MKPTSFNAMALISLVLALVSARAIAQSLGGNGTLPVTTPLLSGYGQLTTASTNSSTTNVFSTTFTNAGLTAVSNNAVGAAISTTISPPNAISYRSTTTTALSTQLTSPNYTPSTTVPPALTPSPAGLGTVGASSKPPAVPSRNAQIGNANSSFAPPLTSSTTPPLAGAPTVASSKSAMVQSIATPQSGIFTPTTFATGPTSYPAGVSSPQSSTGKSFGTMPGVSNSTGVTNNHTPASSPPPFRSTAVRAANLSAVAIGVSTTISVSATQSGLATPNSPAGSIASPTTPPIFSPAMSSFGTLPSMTNKLGLSSSKAPAVTSRPLTSLRTAAVGNAIPSAEASRISSSILANPALLSAITEVKIGLETSAVVIDGQLTHVVLAKTQTTTRWVGTTHTKTTVTTATSVTTAQPFPMPTKIPEKNRAKVDFQFGSGVPPGFYDGTIPMPEHTCPRDAITALARYRHFRRATGQDPHWHQPSIDKCCGVYDCFKHNAWTNKCELWKKVGITPRWEDYGRNKAAPECKEWRTKDEAQFAFYMQNLHYLGISDVDEKGWINEGPRKGKCCAEDGAPQDFGPNLAVKKIIA
ncbi:hypothetical protein H2200_010246 [Cladophialophora chaetospira]|uniref:SCP domain-containing protein n=1 Tax=Cladophialophora chaetospira TaxID=386627 RepID=A0AA38X2J0_9EURO|nr:hypothetical protein H2200_010246 [Cladophialophora chaetospira]